MLLVAAELGHWKLRHTPVNFLMGQIIMLVNFMLFTLMRNSEELYDSFGFTDARPAFIAFVLFQFVMSPVDEVSRLLHCMHKGFGRCSTVLRLRSDLSQTSKRQLCQGEGSNGLFCPVAIVLLLLRKKVAACLGGFQSWICLKQQMSQDLQCGASLPLGVGMQ